MTDIVLKASQLSELTDLTGNEIIFLSINDRAYRVKTSVLVNLFATITKASLGLDRVDNTADLDKPISNRVRMVLDNKANLNHQHTVSDIIDIGDVLDLKANVVHRHNVTDIDGLAELINSVSLGDHIHQIEDVDGLTEALLNKADMLHIHSMNDITNLIETLSQKANLLHTHQIVEVEGLNDSLAGKADVNHIHPISAVTDLQSEIDRLDDRIDSAGTGGVLLPIEISDVNALQTEIDRLDTRIDSAGTGGGTSLPINITDVTNLPESLSDINTKIINVYTGCSENLLTSLELKITSTHGKTRTRIGEVVFYNEAGEKLDTSTTTAISSSSLDSSYTADKTIDGDKATSWISTYQLLPGSPETLTYTFATPLNVHFIEIYNHTTNIYPEEVPKDISIITSDIQGTVKTSDFIRLENDPTNFTRHYLPPCESFLNSRTNLTLVERDISNLNSSFNEKVLTYLSITVGTGGDYVTLGEAATAIGEKYIPSILGLNVDIISDITETGDIYFDNYLYLTIEGNNNTVTIENTNCLYINNCSNGDIYNVEIRSTNVASSTSYTKLEINSTKVLNIYDLTVVNNTNYSYNIATPFKVLSTNEVPTVSLKNIDKGYLYNFYSGYGESELSVVNSTIDIDGFYLSLYPVNGLTGIVMDKGSIINLKTKSDNNNSTNTDRAYIQGPFYNASHFQVESCGIKVLNNSTLISESHSIISEKFNIGVFVDNNSSYKSLDAYFYLSNNKRGLVVDNNSNFNSIHKNSRTIEGWTNVIECYNGSSVSLRSESDTASESIMYILRASLYDTVGVTISNNSSVLINRPNLQDTDIPYKLENLSTLILEGYIDQNVTIYADYDTLGTYSLVMNNGGKFIKHANVLFSKPVLGESTQEW